MKGILVVTQKEEGYSRTYEIEVPHRLYIGERYSDDGGYNHIVVDVICTNEDIKCLFEHFVKDNEGDFKELCKNLEKAGWKSTGCRGN